MHWSKLRIDFSNVFKSEVRVEKFCIEKWPQRLNFQGFIVVAANFQLCSNFNLGLIDMLSQLTRTTHIWIRLILFRDDFLVEEQSTGVSRTFHYENIILLFVRQFWRKSQICWTRHCASFSNYSRSYLPWWYYTTGIHICFCKYEIIPSKIWNLCLMSPAKSFCNIR